MRNETSFTVFRDLTAIEEFRAKLSFDARQKGREYAVEARPPSDATTMCAPELDILGQREVGQHDLQAKSKQAVIDGLEQLQTKSPIVTDVNVERMALESKIAEVLIVHSKDVAEQWGAELDAEAELNAFKDEHNLTRGAKYTRGKAATLATMAMLAVPEFGVSGLLLKELVRSGFIGGYLLALMAGGMTVGLGWLSGVYGIRWLRHIKPTTKLFGLVALVGGSAAGLALQLYLAHTREAIERGGHVIAPVKMSALIANPHQWLDFSSLSPVLLLLFGVVVFILALMKGSGGVGTFLDPYPEFEAYDAPYQDTRNARVASELGFQEAIVNCHDEFREEVRARHARDQVKLMEARLIQKDVDRKLGAIASRALEWDEATLQSLREFRTTNAGVRATGEPPTYFSVTPKLSNPLKLLETTEEIEALIAKFEAVHAKNETALPAIEEAIEAAKHKAVLAIPDKLKVFAVRAQVRVKPDPTATEVPAAGAEQTANPDPPQVE